jgi:SAM-dependent methyltransferase
MGRDFEDHVKIKNPLAGFLMKKYFEKLNELINSIEYTNSIDLGSGKGYVTNYIGKIKNNYPIALDIDKTRTNSIKEKYPFIKTVNADATNIPFEDKSFDLVISTQTIEHLTKNETKKILKEIKRVGKKHSILTVPNCPYWNLKNIARGKYLSRLGNTPNHLQQWTRKSFERLLLENFEDVKVDHVYCWNFATINL